MFEGLSDSDLLDVMREAQRADRVAMARELLAVGRLSLRRMAAAAGEHDSWCVDDWDAIAAEVGAELGISRGRASSLMHHGQVLIENLPKLAANFLAGKIDFRVVAVIVYRTDLIVTSEAYADIDALIACRAPHWNKLSYPKLISLIDWFVLEVDPEALRVARSRDDDRHIEIEPDQYGMAEIWGKLRPTDGAALDQKLDALAATVCRDDPRTKRQRRADAITALVAGEDSMACQCASPQCPAAGSSTSPVVIHMVAETATVEGTSDKPGYVPGFGAVPAATVAELANTAKLRPLDMPEGVAAEPQYRPSTALAEFVRARDLTCRWLGCDRPAWQADIDHTVPYPIGPTHPSNNGCFCRFHHLLKTFYCGPGGWGVRQRPDGTIEFTSPAGRQYTTQPFGAMLFPQLAVPTGEVTPPDVPPLDDDASVENRGLAMPKRKRSRAQDRAYRIQRERNINAARYAADPPPF